MSMRPAPLTGHEVLQQVKSDGRNQQTAGETAGDTRGPEHEREDPAGGRDVDTATGKEAARAVAIDFEGSHGALP